MCWKLQGELDAGILDRVRPAVRSTRRGGGGRWVMDVLVSHFQGKGMGWIEAEEEGIPELGSFRQMGSSPEGPRGPKRP